MQGLEKRYLFFPTPYSFLEAVPLSLASRHPADPRSPESSVFAVPPRAGVGVGLWTVWNNKEAAQPCFLSCRAVVWRGRDRGKGCCFRTLPSPSPFASSSKASESGFFQTLPADKGACRWHSGSPGVSILLLFTLSLALPWQGQRKPRPGQH